MQTDFIPILLGSDVNAYGMARAFHEEYGIQSVAVSKINLTATINTKLIHFEFEEDLENPEKFLKKMYEVADKYCGKKLLVVPCSDGYMNLLIKFKNELVSKFMFNCIDEVLFDALTLKENFYRVCDKYEFAYPKTVVLTREDWFVKPLSMPFPVIIKASNSVEYYKCSFPNKLKVFIASDREEFDRIFRAIYSSSYKDNLTVQEFIPGDDSYMRVLNCYVGQDKKVKLLALGQPLIEEHTPQGIGSYAAVINTFDKELLDKVQTFLENIGYQGFANFDMKYDVRDKKYKLFEINVRQGRSSFFVTASGENLARYLVDDVIYGKEQPLTYARNEHLWTMVPLGVIYKYCQNVELVKKAKKLVQKNKWTNSLFYKKDMKLTRYIKVSAFNLNHYRKFKKYFGKKGFK